MNTCHFALGLCLLALPALADDDEVPWRSGGLELTSIGALTFGPGGVLFIGDAEGAAIIALDTGDTKASKKPRNLDVPDLTMVLAYLTGASEDQVSVHDLAVNPISGRAYLSVTRAGEQPMLVRVDGPEHIEVLDLTKLRYQRLELRDAPEPGGTGRRNRRAMSVTDLGFHEGMLYVAGLSNEEFASKLRAFAFPFDGEGLSTNVEVFHGAHGQWETRSPIRTFLPMNIGGEPHLLAGYTCTPLVTFPVASLTAGAKLRGKTVAELGNRNTPLDMVLYTKNGAEFLLIANSARGVMKVPTAGLSEQGAITARVDGTAGLSYETIEELSNVTQLASLDKHRALILIEVDGVASLRAIDLP